MKQTKRLVALTLALSILFTLLTSFIVVNATPKTVYYHNFIADGLGNEAEGYWHAFPLNGGPEIEMALFETYPNQYLSETDQYLCVRNITKSWYSPCFNVYNILKNNGAGTYHIYIKTAVRGELKYENNKGTNLVIRGASSADENSFIKKQSNGTYYASIGSGYTMFDYGAYGMDGIPWSQITGTVKVLETDITRSSGTFNLCLSNLPVGKDGEMYVEEIKIVKYDEQQITNGNFASGLDGWCSWTEVAYTQPMHQGYTDYTGDASLRCIMDYQNSLFYGRYVRTSTYGSIATSVDQLLSYYGPGRYTLSLDMKMERLPTTIYNAMSFYLTKNMDEYHYKIGQCIVLEDDGWKRIVLNFDISDDVFEKLDPLNSQVHFRIESPKKDIMEYKGSFTSLQKIADNVTIYDITDVSLTAETDVQEIGNLRLTQKGLTITDSPETFTDINNGEVGYKYSSMAWKMGRKSNELHYAIPIGETAYVVSSNTNYIKIESDNPAILAVSTTKKLIANSAGTVNLTFSHHRSGDIKQIQVSVVKIVDNFIGYAQLANGNCWAACAKMCAYQYAGKNGLPLTQNSRALRSAILACGEEKDTPNSLYAGERLANYYLGADADAYERKGSTNENNTGMIVKYGDSNGNSSNFMKKFTKSEVVRCIDGNSPFVCAFDWGAESGHVAVAMGYCYDTDGELCILFFDPCRGGICETGGYRIRRYSELLNNGLQSHGGEKWTQTYKLISAD